MNMSSLSLIMTVMVIAIAIGFFGLALLSTTPGQFVLLALASALGTFWAASAAQGGAA